MRPADVSLQDAARVADALGVDPELGLDSAEAANRLAIFGQNQLDVHAPNPLWRRALAQFADPLILLLLAAVAVSLAAWWVEGAQGMPIDAIVIAAIILLNAALGLAQQASADRALAALADLTLPMSTVLRAGRRTTIPSAQLVPGDVLVLDEGDRVGADARLFRTSSLRVAEAALTGESTPVEKGSATLTHPVELGDRSNMVFAESTVSRGTGRAIVTATGMRTEMGSIAELLARTPEEPTPLQREIGRLGRTLGLVVIGIAIVVMVTVTLVQGVTTPADIVTVLLLGVSLAVSAVPEGLPAILSVVLALGVQRMARRNAVVKSLSSVETLGAASVICTDKTGTLTTNQMTLERILTASGQVDLSGAGYAPDGEALVAGRPVAPGPLLTEAECALRIGSLANDAELTERGQVWQIEGDPTEAAFLVAARKLPGAHRADRRYERIGEVPFTSERKMMSTVHRDDAGAVFLLSKGAPDILLAHCTRVQQGSDAVPLTDSRRAAALADVETLSAAAFRTLGVAYREAQSGSLAKVDATEERDLVYVGVVGIADPPRLEAAEAIREAHAAGIRVVMITGDHPATAARIAVDLGLIDPGARAVTGHELDGLSDSGLRELVSTASVFARVSPEHKLRLIDALQADGQIVAMTGDGVNDAPALKSADIGIAMGVTGTEVTKAAAKMILADDDFATIVTAVREGRVIFDNIRKFLRYLLCSNTGEVLTVFLGVVFGNLLGITQASTATVVLPLLATQILWINLVTDSGPALAMGVDPEVDDVMRRNPRGLTEHAIDGAMWVSIVSTGIAMSVASLLTIDFFLPGGLIPGGDTLAVARTAGFTTLVFAALLTAFNARSATSSVVRGLFANRWLWGSALLGVALQVAVVQLPPLQAAFGTAPLEPSQWAVCVGMASLVLWVEEARKAIVRRRARSRSVIR